MLKFTERPKTPRMTSQKTLLSLKGINCLQVIFVLIWMKQSLIWFNLQRDGTGNGLSNIKDTFPESLQPQMSVLHQSISILRSSRLVSQVHVMAGQNEKKKCLMCQSPSKGIEEGIAGLGGILPSIGRRVLLTRHFNNSLSIYRFLEFEP